MPQLNEKLGHSYILNPILPIIITDMKKGQIVIRKLFNKTSATVAVILLLGGILTVNILSYVHETTPTISSPIISVSGGAGIGVSGGGGSLNPGSGASGSGGAGIGVDGSGSVPTPTVTPPTGIQVDENDFIGEEKTKGNE